VFGMRANALSCVLFAAFVAIVGIGCGKDVPPRAILITATPWIGNTPLIAAAERGLFGDTDVRIVELSTDFDAWRAIHEKRADMSTGTLIDMMRAIDHGVEQKIVLALDYSRGADGIIAAEGIEDVHGLRGKKIAVEQATLTHFLLIRALEKAGMREEDVVLQNLATDEAIVALDDGRVDAAVLWEPMLTRAKKPGRHVVFTSADAPGEIMDALAVRTEVLRDRPNDVKNVIRGFLKSVSVFATDKQTTNATVARLMMMSVPDAEASLGQIEMLNQAQNKALFDRSSPNNIWNAYALSARFMESHGMLRNKPRAADEVLDGTLLEQVSTSK